VVDTLLRATVPGEIRQRQLSDDQRCGVAMMALIHAPLAQPDPFINHSRVDPTPRRFHEGNGSSKMARTFGCLVVIPGSCGIPNLTLKKKN